MSSLRAEPPPRRAYATYALIAASALVFGYELALGASAGPLLERWGMAGGVHASVVAPRTPADTVGPRQQIRLQASFWYGVSSVASLSGPYSAMIKSKNCVEAKAINDRIARTKEALIFGARVHPPTANAMLQNVGKFEGVMPQVKKQFKCKNF